MKTIVTASDLASNGAPPAFDEPLHVGRPNLLEAPFEAVATEGFSWSIGVLGRGVSDAQGFELR
ncbi:MAG: hypothetical protein ACYC7A_05545 [Thermoanaerobaculia bacterium]